MIITTIGIKIIIRVTAPYTLNNTNTVVYRQSEYREIRVLTWVEPIGK